MKENGIDYYHRDHSTDNPITVKLSGILPDKSYIIENYDTGEVLVRTGNELSAGLGADSKRTPFFFIAEV
jgi:hypothetical protein